MKAGKRNIKVLTGFLVLFALLGFCNSAMADKLEKNLSSDPKVEIITEAIKKLTGSSRGRLAAVKELRNAGEYAIPYMLDAMADDTRRDELTNIILALPQIGRDAIRPLAAALQTKDAAIKAEIIKALGKIGYPQSLPYLKYIVEKDDSAELRSLAEQSIRQIDPVALTVPATELFYRLGEKYSHAKSLAPAINAEFANIWFWDSVNERLERKEVDRNYFYELMAERACEWAMKADPGMVDKLQIPSENNTKVQEESVQVAASGDNLMVFGIPMNASLQEVVSVLEKNEINVQSWLISKKRFAEIVSNGITHSYDEYNMSSAEKERALKLLQEGKIKSFDVEYKGKKFVAEPTGLMRLLGTKYPVLEKHCDIYNSQVVLQCRNLPNYMLAQGIRRMHIFFACFNQGVPKSYLISLRIYGEDKGDVICNTLTNKYGVPKLHYATISNERFEKETYGMPRKLKIYTEEGVRWKENQEYTVAKNNRAFHLSIFDLIKKEYPNFVRETEGVVYPKVDAVLDAVIDNLFRDVFPYYPLSVCGFPIGLSSVAAPRFILEWNCKDIKILLSARPGYTSIENDEGDVVGSDIYEKFDSLNYIHWPTIDQLYDLYVKLSDTSEEAEAKMVEKGKKGF
jgi:hypothetical protein